VGNILITGASGLIGTRLTEMLLQKGHHVSHLGRTKKNNGQVKSFRWNVDQHQIDEDALQGIDTIIHLAGAGVADKRWTQKRKHEILESRTRSTQLLFDTLEKRNHSVKSVISASAIGYYGFESSDELTETSAAGKDFLSNVTKQWEEEVNKIESLGIRIIKIRIGIVLSEKGGALKEMMKPIKFYVGAPLGSGNQYVSWIHIDDLCAIFCKAVEDINMRGAYNGVGPYAVTNRTLTRAIAKVLDKPMFLPPVPSFIMKLIIGEMADIVLGGSKVSSTKIQRAGFSFQFDTLEKALRDLLTRN
jgi:uncharacterized protein (TIGR01777 family)